jgi:CspA family cold shock protein
MVNMTNVKISSERLTGRVKWFNNKAGYGFITVSDETCPNDDVFVHHSAITIPEQQYKYLVQGEYVSFTLSNTGSGQHATHATSVSGINNGKLMCETRNEYRNAKTAYRSDNPSRQTDDDAGGDVNMPRQSSAPRRTDSRAPSTNVQRGGARTRGAGPREGGNTEWKLVDKSSERPRQTMGQRSKSDAQAN